MRKVFWIALFGVLVAAGCGGASPTKADREPVEQPPRSEPSEERLVEKHCDLPVSGPWSTFQGDARRHGVSTARPIQNPAVRWRADVGIQGWLNNPVVVADYVFVGSNGSIWNKPDASDGVYALDLETGEVRWFSPAKSDVNGVVYADCLVISTSDDGTVRAHDAKTGEVLWLHRVPERKVYTNPLVVGRKVFTGDSDGFVRSFDLRSGDEQWVADMQSAIRGGLSSDGARVYAASEEGLIRAFELDTGSPVWTANLDPWGVYGSPTIVSGKLVVGFIRDTSYSRPAMAAFDLQTGRTLWKGTNPRGYGGGWGNVRSSPAVFRNLLIWGEPYSNRIVALDIKTGEVTWSSPNGPCIFPHWPSGAIARDQVLMPRHDGGLYAISAEDGQSLWSIYLGDRARVGTDFPKEHREARRGRCEWDPPVGRPIFASPAIAPDGTILIGTGEGVLYAIEEAE